MAAAACSRQDERLLQHTKTLESLGATTNAIGAAWLDSDVSGTYARTAFEDTLRLVEQERTAVAQRPQLLLDARGARLSQAAERLSRLLAVLIEDVTAADGSSARQHLGEIPIAPAESR